MQTAETAAKLLGIPMTEVLVASTGVIGQQIPIEKIKEGVKAMVPILEHSSQAGGLAAEAIMTTDTVKKEVAATVELGRENRDHWRHV